MLVIKIKKLKANNIARASDSLEVVEAEFLVHDVALLSAVP